MICQSASHVPFLMDQSPSLSVSRIELFVIPAVAVDSAGFRVCLRLTSSQGYGWSELFVADTEDMIDLERCSDLLVSFIGIISLPPLQDCQYDKSDKDGRIFELFAAAINQVTTRNEQLNPAELDAEELVLRQRSIHYVSLF
ncbi:hypothetical protein FHS15_001263 [Paenibacillus castaneae]|uniref:hypothetical protein n=1 Tax=Paenibacillus castaneae TaxID=474957 RepID=UPI000C9CF88F|nr:hypothetical protein [Paenibacillus castaneae]NIK76156.1 hypothetical protein [Paenibacillus castaneae]